MKIETLFVEHVKGAREVAIMPADPVINEIAGNNGQGKSSTIDAILYALGGKRHIADSPITHGEDKAQILLDTEVLTVKRTFVREGEGYKTRLIVTAKDGKGKMSQRDLDAIFFNACIDPTEFANAKPADQIEMIKSLAGPEICQAINAINMELEETKAERLLGSRELKKYGDVRPVPRVDPVNVVALAQEKDAITRHNHEQEEIRRKRQGIEKELGMLRERVADLETSLRYQPDPLPLKDPSEIDQKIAEAEETNAKAEAYKKYKEAAARHEANVLNLEYHDSELKRLRSARLEEFEKARLPVEGLRFDGKEIRLGETPFNQLSSAERYRISARLAMATLPPPGSGSGRELRMMIIRDGSLLDGASFAEIVEVARAHQVQLWIETVGRGHSDEAIIIDEGQTVDVNEWLSRQSQVQDEAA